MFLKMFFKNLKLDSMGSKVKQASVLLGKKGSKIQPTDTYTIAMCSAVRAFQKRNNLEVTGVIDWKTWKALKAK